MKVYDLIPSAEKYRDSKGYLKKFVDVIDYALDSLKNYISSLMTRNISQIKDEYLDMFLSEHGLESFPQLDSQSKRLLLKFAPLVWKYKGSEDTFRFLFKVILGYDVTLQITHAKLMDIYGDPDSVSYVDSEMGADVGTENDIAVYSYADGIAITTIQYTVQNYDNDPEKLKVMEYIIRKYGEPVDFSIVTI